VVFLLFILDFFDLSGGEGFCGFFDEFAARGNGAAVVSHGARFGEVGEGGGGVWRIDIRMRLRRTPGTSENRCLAWSTHGPAAIHCSALL
jgi:hypothetical protein